MTTSIDVTYEWTNKPLVALEWLREIPPLAAFDFEAASRFTAEDRERMQIELTNEDLPRARRIELEACLKSSALSHPYYATVTHMSFAYSESHGRVIVFDNKEVLKLVMNWLITTDVTQIWHNASYDFKLIHYLTGGKFPKNYEDTAIRAKCITNHVITQKAKVGLKELMGHHYGNWAVSADYFELDKIYDEDLIKYAATDACATYKLWNQIDNYVKENDGI